MTRGWMSIPALALFLVFALNGCGRRESGQTEPGRTMEKLSFSAAVETDSASGKQVVVLRREGGHTLEARICPAAGANLFSLVYEGVKLILGPQSLAAFNGSEYGIPVLYPTPCRIPQGKFSFEGSKFDFGVNREDTWIHGLVREAIWEYSELVSDSLAARVTMTIDFSPGGPLYNKFDFEHSLSLEYSLDRWGLKISYAVKNRSAERLPFGLGFHPYFNYPASRDEIYLTVPATGRMEMTELVPTGIITKLEGMYDLSQPRQVSSLKMDDVFTGMLPERPAVLEWRSSGVRLILTASKEFTHLIVYDQPENSFFCVENLTCAPDAHNLYAKGFAGESHLLIVPPGGESRGWVQYAIEGMK